MDKNNFKTETNSRKKNFITLQIPIIRSSRYFWYLWLMRQLAHSSYFLNPFLRALMWINHQTASQSIRPESTCIQWHKIVISRTKFHIVFFGPPTLCSRITVSKLNAKINKNQVSGALCLYIFTNNGLIVCESAIHLLIVTFLQVPSLTSSNFVKN